MTRRFSHRWVVAILLIIGLLLLRQRYQLIWNTSPSMPLGLYLVNYADTSPWRGKIVDLQPNSVAQAYDLRVHGTEAPGFIKIAIAVDGDEVSFSRLGVAVNGRRQFGSHAILSLNRRRLPTERYGTYRIQRGYAWGWAPAWDSFDSRYYGPLRVRGTVIPIATWESLPPPLSTNVVYR